MPAKGFQGNVATIGTKGNYMEQLIKAALAAAVAAAAHHTAAGQVVGDIPYTLPKTAVRTTLLIEKTTYTPGEFAPYAERYLKQKGVPQEKSTEYRIISAGMECFHVPDTAKGHILSLDRKHMVEEVARTPDGILLAINAKAEETPAKEKFKPAKKAKQPNPMDYMNGDILRAGSKAKMAELTAQEIYDIRDSKSQLQRGEADYMPGDGQQMKIMLDGLEASENALLSTFEGTKRIDTTQVDIDFVPGKASEKAVLFRFSKKLGLTDADDLAGEPYHLAVEAVETTTGTAGEKGKKTKDDIGLWVNRPAKAKARLYGKGGTLAEMEFLAGQFGTEESLSGELFGKKQTTRVVLNRDNGGLELIEAVETDHR